MKEVSDKNIVAMQLSMSTILSPAIHIDIRHNIDFRRSRALAMSFDGRLAEEAVTEAAWQIGDCGCWPQPTRLSTRLMSRIAGRSSSYRHQVEKRTGFTTTSTPPQMCARTRHQRPSKQ